MSDDTGRLTEVLARAYYEPLGWDMDDLDPEDLRECMSAMAPVAEVVAARFAAARADAWDEGVRWAVSEPPDPTVLQRHNPHRAAALRAVGETTEEGQ